MSGVTPDVHADWEEWFATAPVGARRRWNADYDVAVGDSVIEIIRTSPAHLNYTPCPCCGRVRP